MTIAVYIHKRRLMSFRFHTSVEYGFVISTNAFASHRSALIKCRQTETYDIMQIKRSLFQRKSMATSGFMMFIFASHWQCLAFFFLIESFPLSADCTVSRPIILYPTQQANFGRYIGLHIVTRLQLSPDIGEHTQRCFNSVPPIAKTVKRRSR